MQAQTKRFSRLSKIDWISFFAVNAVSSNPCAGPFIFLSLSTCTEEFVSTPKIITFLTNSLPTEKVPYLSNPKLYPEYLLLSILAFFTNLTSAKKEFSNVDNHHIHNLTNLFHEQSIYLLFFHE